jgi:sulfur relay (sulfurtransferase) DsrC/TusE family protein
MKAEHGKEICDKVNTGQTGFLQSKKSLPKSKKNTAAHQRALWNTTEHWKTFKYAIGFPSKKLICINHLEF